MEERIKIILAILLVVLVSIPISLLKTDIHEGGHIDVAKKNGINLTYELIMENWKEFGKGKATPETEEDCLKFNQLPTKEREDITHAGVNAVVIFFTILMFINGAYLLIFRKMLWYQKRALFIFLIGLEVVFLAVIFIEIWCNVFPPNFCNHRINDWATSKFKDCSIFR